MGLSIGRVVYWKDVREFKEKRMKYIKEEDVIIIGEMKYSKKKRNF